MKKIIILTLISVIFCYTPVMAKDTLTIEQATKKAISYSHKLKTLSENLDEANEKRKNAVKEFERGVEGYEIMNLATNLRTILNNIEAYELNEETEKISIEFSVKQFFADVIMAEQRLELYRQKLDISNKNVEIAKLKTELGLISQSEYTKILNENTQLKSQIVTEENSIKNAYISLNTVMGVKDLETSYHLEYKPEYKPYDGASLTTTLNKAKATAQSLLKSQQNYDLSVYKLKNFTEIDPDKGESRTKVQNQVSQAARQLEESNVSLETQIRQDYDSIIQYQLEYENACSKLKELENTLKISQLKFKLGKITELELKQAEYDVENQKKEIEKIVYNYNLLKERFENPILY